MTLDPYKSFHEESQALRGRLGIKNILMTDFIGGNNSLPMALENPTDQNLVMIEVRRGKYLYKSDFERFDDTK